MSYIDLPPILEKMLGVSDLVSDLNFSVGRPAQVEVNGKLVRIPDEVRAPLALSHTTMSVAADEA